MQCVACPEGHWADEFNLYQCTQCPRGYGNVGVGNAKCKLHRSPLSAYLPVVVTAVYAACYVATFSYLYFTGVLSTPSRSRTRIDVTMLCIIGCDRVIFAQVAMYAIFKWKTTLYVAVAVILIPLLRDFISGIVHHEKRRHLACVVWSESARHTIDSYREDYDPNLSSWWAHNLRIGNMYGPVVFLLDLLWPVVRIGGMCVVVALGCAFQLCISSADVRCLHSKDTCLYEYIGNDIHSACRPGRLRISFLRTVLRVLLQGGIILLNCRMLRISIWKPIGMFDFASFFPLSAVSIGLSSCVLIGVLMHSVCCSSSDIHTPSIEPTPLSTHADPRVKHQQTLKTQTLAEPQTNVTKSATSLTTSPPHKPLPPPSAPPKPISQEVMLGVASMQRERLAYTEARRTTDIHFVRSRSFEVTRVQSLGLKKPGRTLPRLPSSAYDMELEDV